MNTHNTSFGLWASFLFVTLLSNPLLANFTEPPTRLYGKVIHLGAGTSYQVYAGELSVVIYDADNVENQVTLTTQLAPLGAGNAFSYELDIPQMYLPDALKMDDYLSIGSNARNFQIASITLDGNPADFLDTAQSTLSVTFNDRAGEHRLDLKVSFDEVDTDGDGMPDWWENLFGLNPNDPNDASSDIDNDTLTALAEFLGGTDPTVDNSEPEVIASSVLLAYNGYSGLMINIVDANDDPADITIQVDTIDETKVMIHDSSGAFDTVNDTFTYAQVLNGELMLVAQPGFVGHTTISVTATDLAMNNASGDVIVRPLSPATHAVIQPALWLNATSLSAPGDLEVWADLSGNNRDGFQGVVADQPAFDDDSGNTPSLPFVDFDGGDLFYLDDQQLALDSGTGLLAFSTNAFGPDDQVLFYGGGLEISLGGSDSVTNMQSLRVRESTGRELIGPVIMASEVSQLSWFSAANRSVLRKAGGVPFFSVLNHIGFDFSFPTIGGAHVIGEADPQNLLSGAIHEVIFYDEVLDAETLSRIEDYQMSRWQSLVLWDHRDETVPLSLTGFNGVRNSLNGGWGQDNLIGAELDDLLRGGPSDDTFTGNAGADRFQIFMGDGNDRISDFSESEGDHLDLSALFQDHSGTPEPYVNLRVAIVRENNIPRLDTIVELDFEVDGVVDQEIALTNIVWQNADLPRLVGEGYLQLGGLRYTTDLFFAGIETELIETAVARTFTITRQGNLDSSLGAYLSFGGTADDGEDFELADLQSAGLVHWVYFERGEDTTTFTITPQQDLWEESEVINISVLPLIGSELGNVPELEITLDDAPVVTVEALVPYAQRVGPVPGRFKVSRSGPLDAPMTVNLNLAGTAINGIDYEPISPQVIFDSGEAVKEIEVRPLSGVKVLEPKLAQLSVEVDQSQYITASPWSAAVSILDGFTSQPTTISKWASTQNFTPAQLADLAILQDVDDDSDFRTALEEYIRGSDSSVSDPLSQFLDVTSVENGRVLVTAKVREGLADVGYELAYFIADPLNTIPVEDLFTLSLERLSDGFVELRYLSKQGVDFTGGLMWVLDMNLTEPLFIESPASAPLADLENSLLAQGPAWVPAIDSPVLKAPRLASGETVDFVSNVTGPFRLDFDWTASLGAGDTLRLLVNGEENQVLTAGETDWTSVVLNITEEGRHTVSWELARQSSEGAVANWGASLRNVTLQ
ncbi:Calx-beta domain-containing protein [Rubellicoccus peritrichatus]|uniref:Type I secretion C-terminal target domain-containing protein n=1 Tax=Rubellicoccus peritrichatus TaxID=3080537 RepID=A0AAQ3LBU5_9BACT|nr:Calx-beta domain-containing protein [Puniceicoccus sp. CR14]WOO41005.1 type I secretion C-terminal target domain-containing protein [Puniceicoccus sp. CR14]